MTQTTPPTTPGNDVKAKFFALYYNQPVLRYQNNTIHPIVDCNVLDESRNNLKHAFFQLRTLSQLTDDEKENLSIISDKESEDELYPEQHIVNGAYILREMKADEPYRLPVYDYLRLIGILAPFTYLDEDNKPQTLSIDDIIELRWVITK